MSRAAGRIVQAKKVDIATGAKLIAEIDTHCAAPCPVICAQAIHTPIMAIIPAQAQSVRPRTHMYV